VQLKVLYYDNTTKQMTRQLGTGKRVSGLESLVQHFIILLFTTGGSDTLNPELGGSMPKVGTLNFASNDLLRVYRNVGIAVLRVKEQMLEQQIGLNLPANEKLKDASVLKTEADGTRLKVWIYIESQSGESASFSM